MHSKCKQNNTIVEKTFIFWFAASLGRKGQKKVKKEAFSYERPPVFVTVRVL